MGFIIYPFHKSHLFYISKREPWHLTLLRYQNADDKISIILFSIIIPNTYVYIARVYGYEKSASFATHLREWYGWICWMHARELTPKSLPNTPMFNDAHINGEAFVNKIKQWRSREK